MTTRRRDFTIDVEPIEFTIDADLFHAPAIISAPVLLELNILQQRLDDLTTMAPADALTLVGDVFDLLLEPASAARFRERLHSRTEPIDLKDQAMRILAWLVEEWTGRPTPPSAHSASGPTSNGGGSTDGAPPAESTPLTLTVAGSAT